MCNLLGSVFRVTQGILANMERHVGELDMRQFQQKRTFIFCLLSLILCLALCLIEGEKETNDPEGGASQKQTHS